MEPLEITPGPIIPEIKTNKKIHPANLVWGKKTKKSLFLLAVLIAICIVIYLLFTGYIKQKFIPVITKDAILQDPDKVSLSYEKAIIGTEDGKEINIDQKNDVFRVAITELEKALESQPNDINSLSQIASSYYNLGDFEKASRYLKELIKLRPEDDLIYNNLANVLRDGKKFQEAATYYQKAIELNSQSPIYYINYAAMLKEQNSISEAVKLIKDGISKSTNDRSLQEYLVHLMEYQTDTY